MVMGTSSPVVLLFRRGIVGELSRPREAPGPRLSTAHVLAKR